MDATSGLTPEQHQELSDAREAAKSFLGAGRVAAMNGWTLGFFAAVSLLFGIFSATSLVIGVGLGVVVRNELVGRKRLRSFDPLAFVLLWKNQVGLLSLIVAYCLWSMYRVVAFPDPQLEELTQLLGPGTQDLVRDLSLVLYGSVIVGSAAYQGWNARYYFVRIARAEAFVKDTPPWVVEVLREAQQ